jgi:hypothetical protein
MNIRSHGELDPGLDPAYRNFMYSDDGGETWGGLETKHDLPWESGHGSITKLTIGSNNRLIAFHPLVVKRRDLTCFVSYDEGKTWPHRKLIHEAGGYTSTIVLDNFDIAMSHNHGFKGEEGIDFVRFNMSWLTDGEESVRAPARRSARVQPRDPTRGDVWREDFDLPDGARVDNDDTAWSIRGGGSDSGSGVSHGKFRALDTGEGLVWQTEQINVSNAAEISIAVDAIKIGHFNGSDRLRIYYRVGEGEEILLESLSFSSDPQEDFETYQIRKDKVRVAGQGTVQVIIRARVTGEGKSLYWDRVRIGSP